MKKKNICIGEKKRVKAPSSLRYVLAFFCFVACGSRWLRANRSFDFFFFFLSRKLWLFFRRKVCVNHAFSSQTLPKIRGSEKSYSQLIPLSFYFCPATTTSIMELCIMHHETGTHQTSMLMTRLSGGASSFKFDKFFFFFLAREV